MNAIQPLIKNVDLPSDDDIQSSDLLSQISANQTVDSSTQVNFDQILSQQQGRTDHKTKRKLYKQRKKLKRKLQQESAKNTLSSIIQAIYEDGVTFENKYEEIKECLIHLGKQPKFYEFLNVVMKQRVNIIKQNISQFWESIFQENPLKQDCQEDNFYYSIIDNLYKEYSVLKISCREVQKIINTYMDMISNSNDHNQYHELDKNIFGYLIETQQNIKNFIGICQKQLSTYDNIHRYRLLEILSLIDPIEDQQQYRYMLEQSTSIEDEDLEEQNIKKKKKKNKKNKAQQYSSNYDVVLERLQNMVISVNNRQQCNVEASWIASISKKVKDQ